MQGVVLSQVEPNGHFAIGKPGTNFQSSTQGLNDGDEGIQVKITPAFYTGNSRLFYAEPCAELPLRKSLKLPQFAKGDAAAGSASNWVMRFNTRSTL